MRNFGGWELLLILALILIIFGPERIGKVAGQLGAAIRNFREGLSGDKKEEPPRQ